MKLSTLTLTVLFTVLFSPTAFGQKAEESKPIVNGRAVVLPIPDYPKEAEEFCVAGKVEVEVLIGESGNVIEAEAISGDEFLRTSAVEAARKAKFRLYDDLLAVKSKGILVYNFVPKQKCISVGIVTTRALKLPKPPFPSTFNGRIKEQEIVVVQIIIDMSGNVTFARAIIGHPVFRQASEVSARQTKFAPTLIDGAPIKINALLAYKFCFGKVETKIEKDDKDVVGLPINLVAPPPPFCNCRFGGSSSVIVQVEIDEQGNVVKAMALFGHPILKLSSEKAALESKFIPANIKTKKYIRYNFEEINKYQVKLSSVGIVELKSGK